MSENKKVENNVDQKATTESILEEGEIMRLSVKEVEGGYRNTFCVHGPKGPMIDALSEACAELDLVCFPKEIIDRIYSLYCTVDNFLAQFKEGSKDGEENNE